MTFLFDGYTDPSVFQYNQQAYNAMSIISNYNDPANADQVALVTSLYQGRDFRFKILNSGLHTTTLAGNYQALFGWDPFEQTVIRSYQSPLDVVDVRLPVYGQD